ncbi:MAG: hypothetical protein ACR2NM_14795 [Bythopirellula sp.]
MELGRSLLRCKITTLSVKAQVGMLVGLVAIGAIGASPGCSSADPADLLAAANDSNIQRLANLYEAFQSRHNWRGPKDEADLKSFLEGWNPNKLANIGVNPEAIDEVFVSERDGEPLQIRYGVPGHIMGSEAAVVFEKTGIDGRRMVGFLNMTRREVDAAEYDRLWAGNAGTTNNSARQR